MTSIFPVGVAILLVLVVHAYSSDPLRSVPGPLLARFIRFWELSKVRELRFEYFNDERHQSTRNMVRLWEGQDCSFFPARPSVTKLQASPSDWRRAGTPSTTRARQNRSTAPRPSSPSRASTTPLATRTRAAPTLFNSLGIQEHGQKGRRVAGLYSVTSLLSYEPLVDQPNKTLCDMLRGFRRRRCGDQRAARCHRDDDRGEALWDDGRGERRAWYPGCHP